MQTSQAPPPPQMHAVPAAPAPQGATQQQMMPAGPVAATWAAISVSYVYRGLELHTLFDLMH